jgi:hypothetical protein
MRGLHWILGVCLAAIVATASWDLYGYETVIHVTAQESRRTSTPIDSKLGAPETSAGRRRLGSGRVIPPGIARPVAPSSLASGNVAARRSP